jgi:hypothetical protein
VVRFLTRRPVGVTFASKDSPVRALAVASAPPCFDRLGCAVARDTLLALAHERIREVELQMSPAESGRGLPRKWESAAARS